MVQVEQLNSLKKILEKFSVKIQNFKTVQDTPDPGVKLIILNPNLIKTFRWTGPITFILFFLTANFV